MAVCPPMTFELRHTRGTAGPFMGHTLDHGLSRHMRALKNPGCAVQGQPGFTPGRYASGGPLRRADYMS